MTPDIVTSNTLTQYIEASPSKIINLTEPEGFVHGRAARLNSRTSTSKKRCFGLSCVSEQTASSWLPATLHTPVLLTW